MKKPSTNADNWVCRKYELAVEDPLLEQTMKRAKEQSKWHCKSPTMEELLVVAIFSFQALSFLLFCTEIFSLWLSFQAGLNNIAPVLAGTFSLAKCTDLFWSTYL